MRNYNTQAVVLKSIKYKDADKIFTLFTKDFGKVSAIARGVRKITSKRGGNLDTLNLVSVAIHDGNTGFKDIEEVKTLESFRDLKKDLKKSVKAYYLVELVHKAVEEGEKNERLFNLLVNCLKTLQKNSRSGVIVCYFEMHLMDMLGYKMTLDKCARCGRKLDEKWKRYTFNVENGSFECENCSRFGISVSKEVANSLFQLFKSKITPEIVDSIVEIDKLTKIYTGRKLESRFKSLEID